MYFRIFIVCLTLTMMAVGCSKPAAKNMNESKETGTKSTAAADSINHSTKQSESATNEEKKTAKIITPITLGGSTSPAPAVNSSGINQEKIESDKVAIRQMLKPFQILVGSWRGLTNKSRESEGVDTTSWAWDLLSDPVHPSLVMTTKGNPLIQEARLTYLTDKQLFKLSVPDGKQQRHFVGNFSQAVQDAPGDNDKLQRTYKLEMTEVESEGQKEQFRYVINQQGNNRYLLEIYRRKGSGEFSRIDTVATQRDGTSFALSDSDYGEKTCIISQGLGTIQVSYQGKNFWVCCGGCKAAFEDDPVRWITLWEQKKKSSSTNH